MQTDSKKITNLELANHYAFLRMMNFNKKYPETKEIYRAMQQWQLQNKPTDGVYYPSTQLSQIAPKILVHHMTHHLPNGGYDDMSSYYWGLHIFGAWRNTLGIYRFDDKLFTEVYNALIPDDTPSTIFSRLPEWCVYIDFPKATVETHNGEETNPCEGFWAVYDRQPYNGRLRTVLSLFLNYPSKLLGTSEHLKPYHIVIDDNLTVKESLIGMLSQTTYQTDDFLASRVAATNDANLHELIRFMLSLLLWLCAEEPDITNRAGEPVGKGQLRKPKYGINKRTGSFITPNLPVIYELGKCMGGEIRQMNERLAQIDAQGKGTGSRKRPHIRRGHWHGVWTGTGQDKHYKLNWIKPIFVNAD